MKTVLVHDWLTGMRGGERVLEQIAELFPDAPILTLLHHRGSVSAAIERHPIRTSFLQRLPGRSAYRWYLPLFPRAIESLDPGDAELIVSSSHCVAKSVVPPPGAVHVCYCHTPMRYAWDQFAAYFSPARNGALRYLAIRTVIRRLRRWDVATAVRVHAFAANSRYVARRIERYYGRSARVVPPPVDTERFTPGGGQPEGYWLVVSALSPYKRVELAIEAFNRSGRPLLIAGWGPERARLERLAGPSVRLLGRVDDDRLLELYRGCRGLLLPAVEDAGIVQLEAMACGRPALVLAEGGAAETVVDGETGLVVPEATPGAIVRAVDTAERIPFNSRRIREHAERYSIARFRRRFLAFVHEVLREHRAPAEGRPGREPARPSPPPPEPETGA